MINSRITWLSATDGPDSFPPIALALTEPDGLLAAGGDLSAARLLAAYRRGIFPWYEDGQPILWWSPDPRCTLRPGDFHLSRSFTRALRQSGVTLSFNRVFDQVIRACAGPRRSEQGTWITDDMMAAYEQMHTLGWAHSVEIWRSEQLIGGLYGIGIGHLFFAESMFSRETNGSKFAMFGLCHYLQQNGFALIDCQVVSEHLLTLGATSMPREQFGQILAKATDPVVQIANWPDKPVPLADLLGNVSEPALQ